MIENKFLNFLIFLIFQVEEEMVVYTVSKEENFMQLKAILRANNDFLNDLKEKLQKVRFTTTLKKS